MVGYPGDGAQADPNGYAGTMQIRFQLDRITKRLPTGFDRLQAEAHAEGFRSLDRLAADWAAGTMRFDRAGEVLLAARSNGELAGIGGLTIDPADPAALRMRRFYVGQRFRRCGVGRRLVAALLEEAVRTVTVNAGAGSPPF